MDVAASEFFRSGKYDLDFKSPDDPSRYITHDELANLYKSFIKDYPGESFRTPPPFQPLEQGDRSTRTAGDSASVRVGGRPHHSVPEGLFQFRRTQSTEGSQRRLVLQKSRSGSAVPAVTLCDSRHGHSNLLSRWVWRCHTGEGSKLGQAG